jgi:hypothetical protein
LNFLVLPQAHGSFLPGPEFAARNFQRVTETHSALKQQRSSIV